MGDQNHNQLLESDYISEYFFEVEDNKEFNLEETLTKFIAKDRELIAKLIEISDQLKASRKYCNMVKTTGVSISGSATVMSIASLCLAAFTGGASLSVTIPAALSSIVGGLVSSGANIAEGLISQLCLKEAQDLQVEQLKLVHELTIFKERTNAIVDQLVKWGRNEDQAMTSVLKSVKYGILSSTESLDEDNIFADAVVVDESMCELDSTDDSPKIGNTGASSQIKSGILGVSTQVGKVVQKFTPIEARITAAIFRSSTAASTTTSAFKGMAQGAAAAAGFAFTVVDIVYLVKSWKYDHPLIPQIEMMICGLEQDIKDCKKMLDAYDLL